MHLGTHICQAFTRGSDLAQDTQCGFKLFTRVSDRCFLLCVLSRATASRASRTHPPLQTAAQKLFPVQHLKRWAFDVELLYLAQRKKLPVTVG